MGVWRQLGKGDQDQLVYLEKAFNDAPDDTIIEFRRELLAGTPLIPAVAATLLMESPLLKHWNLIGTNWFGPRPTHQWLEPCTPPEVIEERVIESWVVAINMAVSTKPRMRVELWCKCGYPNFEVFVTSHPSPADGGLVVLTYLTPDMHDGYPVATAPTPTATADPTSRSGAAAGVDYSTVSRAVAVGAQDYPIRMPS